MSNVEPNKIFVKFLPTDTTIDEIKQIFGRCGPVVKVFLAKPKSDKVAKVTYIYGFVTYETQDAADQAVLEFNGKQMKPEHPEKLYVVHSYIQEPRLEQGNFKEPEKNSTQEDYHELLQRCQENEKKISQIYNKPGEEKEIEELQTRERELEEEQIELKKTKDALKEEIEVLRLRVQIENLEMENTKLKEAQ